ncbi:MAG: excinuclease ABC subunit UvrC [Alphaproteobacteria bacterium]|nr:excinuclease ABC subunit UvrC [Alphaproteobacteria bacterium]
MKTLPGQPGVYRMLGEKGAVLYVGKAKNLKNRVTSYTQRERLPHRLQRMVAQTRGMEIVVTRTEAEALLLEASLIQRFAPPFNILFRDDKSYPYIVITRDHDFPQLLKHRGLPARSRGFASAKAGKHARKGWYFGPFASVGAVDETLTLLQRAFMLRNCSNPFFEARKRPCLQYHIKRCTAPCVGKVSQDDYARQVEAARDFLRGKSALVQKRLATEMQEASAGLDYERAAVLRDRIRALTSIQARQGVHIAGLGDADVIAVHQAAGRTVIQVFFYRADRNYGTRTFYPAHGLTKQEETPSPAKTKALPRKARFSRPLPQGKRDTLDSGRGLMPPGAILSAFIAQFYADKLVPPLLLLNHAPEDASVLAKALTEKAGHNVKIIVPARGEKKRLVDLARQNAKAALGRKMSESSEQEKLLRRVAEIFALPETPRRIEVYDNSHISGTFASGAMIAAGPEGLLKKTYRKFNIREAAAGDDTGMMREVLTRRFRRLIDEDPERHSGLWPDLILIDGGQGQLNRAAGVLQELGVTDVAVASIAKGPDRNAGRERFFLPDREPLSLPPDDPALYYLQRLRDEAHRFAIGAHRARRTKVIGQSGLEDLPGIGAVRKRALLQHFGSAKAVAGAGVEDIARVQGISAVMAKKIHDYFQGAE